MKKRRNSNGGRKFKLNLKILIGLNTGIITNGCTKIVGRTQRIYCDRKTGLYRFVFENGCTLEVKEETFFLHTLLKYENGSLLLKYTSQETISCLIAYSLYETYGLPLDFTADEAGSREILVDEEGFNLLKDLQQMKNKNTFQNTEAFSQRGDEIHESIC